MADEIKKEELCGVAGGTGDYSDIVAYCTECGAKLECIDARRIEGGLTNIFVCKNSNCSEFNKEKNNLEVKWP